MKNITAIIIAAAFVCACACSGSGKEEPQKPDSGNQQETVYSVTAWTTTADKTSAFAVNDKIAFTENAVANITLNSNRYQKVYGFGTAITQAACYNLLKMSDSDRSTFLKEIFSPTEGFGSSLIRVCIGGSDFSMDEFTWCDTPGIENFAVHDSDRQYLFPILDEIYKINPDVRIIASPWSAPKWMKRGPYDNNPYDKWTNGRLNPVYYADYATYFVKWIQEMEKRGYYIEGITIQNEPLNRGNSMSMFMGWDEQRDFIKTALGPAFQAAGIKAQILLFDHNYNYDNLSDQQNYPVRILQDEEAARYVGGSAWHSYGGSVSTLDNIYNKYPDRDIYFTEASIGTWNHRNFSDNFVNDFREEFIGVLARGGSGSIVWNLMLDKDGKPYRPGGCSTCYGAVSIGNNYSYTSIVRNTHYYFVAHCSKVIRPGAVRVGFDGAVPEGLTVTPFLNSDNSYGVVILNSTSTPKQLTIKEGAHFVRHTVPGSAIVSLSWKK